MNDIIWIYQLPFNIFAFAFNFGFWFAMGWIAYRTIRDLLDR